MKPEFSVSLMCMDFLDIKHQIEILDQTWMVITSISWTAIIAKTLH